MLHCSCAVMASVYPKMDVNPPNLARALMRVQTQGLDGLIFMS